jgi:hypothetical protein
VASGRHGELDDHQSNDEQSPLDNSQQNTPGTERAKSERHTGADTRTDKTDMGPKIGLPSRQERDAGQRKINQGTATGGRPEVVMEFEVYPIKVSLTLGPHQSNDEQSPLDNCQQNTPGRERAKSERHTGADTRTDKTEMGPRRSLGVPGGSDIGFLDDPENEGMMRCAH